MGRKESNQTKKILVSCCDISRGGGGEYSDILVIYVGSDHFFGFKTLNFNTFWGFHKKKNIFGGGGGYEEIVDIFLGPLQIGLFWGSFLFLYILGFFKDQGTEWEYFWGITKFQVWGVCLIFLYFFCGGGGGGGGGQQKMLGPSLGMKKN